MSKIKRALSLLLTVVMLANALPFSTITQAAPSDWAVREVALAQEAGLLTEKIKTNYQKGITREEFCELIYNFCSIVGELVVDDGHIVFEDTNNIIHFF